MSSRPTFAQVSKAYIVKPCLKKVEEREEEERERGGADPVR